MAIKTGIILLLLLGFALAGLFFVIAWFLFFAPEALVGAIRTGMAIGCAAGGTLLLVPILVLIAMYCSGLLIHAKKKKEIAPAETPKSA